MPLPPHRLVTGARNGTIKLWNYNNGQCIRSLDKGMHVVQSAVGEIKQKIISKRIICGFVSEGHNITSDSVFLIILVASKLQT